MRLIGHVTDEVAARTFGDYLYVRGIENQLDYEKSAGWAIWINDEDKIELATKLLEEFRADPKNSKYGSEKEQAAKLRAKEEADQEAYRKRLRNRRHLFRPLTAYGFGPLTFVLIAISVVAFILAGFGKEPQHLADLYITHLTFNGDTYSYLPGLHEIRQGQIWRLITPIFIHMDPLHIFFDMWVLRDFGSMIEARQSSFHLVVLTVIIGAASNFGQYCFGHGAGFGGMSGVDYGLMGYIWIRGKFDPGSGLFLHPSTVTMMIVWFFACLSGYVGNIANWAHGIGLVMGMAWGYLSSWRYRPGKRK